MMAASRRDDGEEPGGTPVGDGRPQAPARARRPAVTFRITHEQEFLRSELANRETVEEMRDFLRAVVRNSTRCAAILIQVRASKPLFHVERDGLIGFLQQLARAPQHRIALLADTPDLQASHEYLELIARQHGVRVRAFRAEAEAEALLWLKDRRDAGDRRRGGERRQGTARRQENERRNGGDRRQTARRASPGA